MNLSTFNAVAPRFPSLLSGISAASAATGGWRTPARRSRKRAGS